MKAIVYEKYGSPDVLRLEDVGKPVPGDNEALIRIHAASVNAYDWHLLTADIFLVRLMGGGVMKPRNTRPGVDVAGRIEAVGRNVGRLRPCRWRRSRPCRVCATRGGSGRGRRC